MPGSREVSSKVEFSEITPFNFLEVRSDSDAVNSMSPTKFEFGPTQVNTVISKKTNQ